MRIAILFVAIWVHTFTGGNVAAQTGGTPTEADTITIETLKADLDNPGLRIIDVRRIDHYGSGSTKIAGAVRRDPNAVSTWIQQYSKSDRIILYCA